MNSLEFIKMHVDEWPSTDRHQLTHCMLLSDGILAYGAPMGVGRINPYEHIDLSEHFAPDYYDGQMWPREDFESCGRLHNNIEWKKGAVCYVAGKQWFCGSKTHLHDGNVGVISVKEAVEISDFQLNEPRQGDYMPKSELDTEQKYNDAVEELGFFGFKCHASYYILKSFGNLYVEEEGEVHACNDESDCNIRKITYNQLITIGKLKKMLNKGEDTLSGHFIGLDNAIHSCDFDKIVFHSDKILEFSPNPTEGEKVNTKESKAYNLLKSMDIYYDEDLKLWYKKEFL